MYSIVAHAERIARALEKDVYIGIGTHNSRKRVRERELHGEVIERLRRQRRLAKAKRVRREEQRRRLGSALSAAAVCCAL